MIKLAKIQMGLVLGALVLLVGAGVAVAASPPAPAPPGGTLDQRITQRKAERALAPTTEDTERIISSCGDAQTKLRLIQNSDSSMLDNRSKVYGKIDAKLWIATGELKLAGQDTFQLQKELANLAGQITTFQATAESYKQALDDSLLINCKADPVGFQALLDTVRLYYDQLRVQSQGINDYVVDTVKPDLQTFVVKLQPKASSSKEN